MGVDTLLKMVPQKHESFQISPLNRDFLVLTKLISFPIQIFVDNFVHGDLHPGNILVQCRAPIAASSDGSGLSGEHHGKTTLTDLLDTVVVSVRPDPCPLQLVLLDAGIVAQLSDHDLANFKAVFTAVVLRQVRAWRSSGSIPDFVVS